MRNRSAYILMLLVVTGLLLLCNCKKPGNIPNHPVDPALKALFTFKPGSYWIYKDSISGETDSFFVRFNAYARNNGPNSLYTVDQVETYVSQWDVASHSDSNIWEILLVDSNIELSYDINTIYHNMINYPAIVYPFRDYNINTNDGYNVVSKNISQIVVSGNTFSNVDHIHFTSTDPLEKGLSDDIYINSEVGIMKIIFNHPYDSVFKIWMLERYNIVR